MKHRKHGGAATVFPLKYFNSTAREPSASSGIDLLPTSGNMVRPRIGGKSKTRNTRNKSKTRRKRGGFVPSVMGGFVEAASKYIVPLALFAGYKLMTKKKSKAHHTLRH